MTLLEGFEELLRMALNQLYDPVFLRHSSLVHLLHLENELNPAQALQSSLTNAIRALKPSAKTPRSSRSRRYYQILYYRYVQQYTQSDVARKVSLSPRHLRREQRAAIRALRDHLCSCFGVELSDPQVLTMPNHATVETELGGLGDSLVDHSADVGQLLSGAARLVAGLVHRHHVDLRLDIGPNLPLAAVARTTLKSIVLDLLTAALRSVPGGAIMLSARRSEGSVAIRVRATPSEGSEELCLKWNQDELAVPQRLATMFCGTIDVQSEGRSLSARLVFPSARQVLVLAIEDNTDTIQLWKRYVEGTPYRLVGVSDPTRALPSAAELKPAIIILDVMMPGIDGWDVLGRLQYHPATRSTPVIVCTVHPQRELALSLGASDFIGKPTTRQVFLTALERQSAAGGYLHQPGSVA